MKNQELLVRGLLYIGFSHKETVELDFVQFLASRSRESALLNFLFLREIHSRRRY